MPMRRTGTLVAILLTLPATAETVVVEVAGKVEYNQVSFGALGNVDAGDDALLSFTINSESFITSPSFPTRGYEIDQTSFALTLGSTTVGLQNPWPLGLRPFFVIRDNDPAVDGFLVSTSFNFPEGVPIDQNGQLEQFNQCFSVAYDGSMLPSLDILDAVGTYDFTGLKVFNWTIDDGPFNPVGMIFATMTISTLADCPEDTDGNDEIDVDDLVAVILAWGTDDSAADVNDDGVVDVDDVVQVILAWGSC